MKRLEQLNSIEPKLDNKIGEILVKKISNTHYKNQVGQSLSFATIEPIKDNPYNLYSTVD